LWTSFNSCLIWIGRMSYVSLKKLNSLINGSAKVLMTLAFLFLITNCQKKVDKDFVETPELKAKRELFERGKIVYISECIACHNLNPKMQGSMGPDLYGSSEELIRQRVLYAKYPEGYKPKRTTELMTELGEEFAKDIPALHVFLNK
jgi:mono/diheme cytochrome c family protein